MPVQLEGLVATLFFAFPLILLTSALFPNIIVRTLLPRTKCAKNLHFSSPIVFTKQSFFLVLNSHLFVFLLPSSVTTHFEGLYYFSVVFLQIKSSIILAVLHQSV